MAGEFANLEFTDTFLKSLLRGRFSTSEQASLLEVLRLLDSAERNPSLRVHERKIVWHAFTKLDNVCTYFSRKGTNVTKNLVSI